MKVLNIFTFTTEAGTNKTVEIELDTRPGLLFEIVTNNYHTAKFNKGAGSIPAIMYHNDRDENNVSVLANDTTVTIKQGYQQVKFGFLVTYAPNDWLEPDELRPVYIDAMSIYSITLTNDQEIAVKATYENAGVRLSSLNFTPVNSTYYSKTVKSKNGKEYIFHSALQAHAISQLPTVYDYISESVSRVLQVYEREV